MTIKNRILAGLAILAVTACRADDNDKAKGPDLISPTDPSLQASSVVPSAEDIVGKWFRTEKNETGADAFEHELTFKDDGTYGENVFFYRPFFGNYNSGTYSITEGILHLENGWFGDMQIELRTVLEDGETVFYIDLVKEDKSQFSLKSVE